VPTAEGFRLFNEQVTSDPRFRAGLRILVDCSALDTVGLSNQELQGFSEHFTMRDWNYPPAAVCDHRAGRSDVQRRAGVSSAPGRIEVEPAAIQIES
jgi:hypothetical protein